MIKAKKNEFIISIVLIIVFSCVSALGVRLYHSSNYYRFKLDSLSGEYVTKEYLQDESPKLGIRFYDEDESGNFVLNKGIKYFFEENGKYVIQDNHLQKHDADSYIDEDLIEFFKYYMNLLTTKCVVSTKEIKLLPSGEVMNITESSYYYEKKPVRKISFENDKFHGSGYFEADYHDKIDWSIVWHTMGIFHLTIEDVIYEANDGSRHKIDFWKAYFSVEDYNEYLNMGEIYG